ncbi:hypothetical protein Tco_1361837 [Tanacetum coccineum]
MLRLRLMTIRSRISLTSDTEAQNVPTEVSADTSDKISMIAILTDLQTQLDGHAKIPKRSQLDLEHKVRLGTRPSDSAKQADADVCKENDCLIHIFSGKEKSITFLQSEKEKILSEKKDLADSYLDEIELSREQAYWLPANEIASQTSNPNSPVTPFVRKSRLQQVRPSLRIKKALQWKDDTISEFRNSDQHRECLNVVPLKVVVTQALDTDRLTENTISSLRIQLDGLKVENVSLKRRYDELSKANTHSRTAYTEKLSAFTAENTKLKAQVTGKTSSGPSTSEKPKVLASGMYTNSSKYIPPPKRANWVKPTPLPKKKQVTFQEPPRTSNRPTQKPPVQQNKKPNVPVHVSTRTKPATESRKPMPKCHTRNHRILPNKSVNARRAADHNRKLNVVYHNQFVIRSLKSVNTKTPHAKHSVNHTKKVWKATRNHNVNTTKTAWRPTGKIVGSVKPQWKPTGRHFALYDNCPLTRIVEPIVEPLELTPSVSSSSKVTKISRFPDCKLSDRKAGSKGISGIRGTSLSRAGKPVKKVLLMNLSDHSFRCKTHAHIHTTVSEVIKKVFIQGFRTISENQCLLQILKVTMIGRRDIIKAFKDSNRYEHDPDLENLAIRILLAVATFYDYEIWQMDVKTAFLNGHDLGESTYILGIKIIRDRSKQLIALSQSAYLEKILKKFRMENSKKGYTQMVEKPDYRKSQGAQTPNEQNPCEIHWTAVKTILKYLRNNKDMVLVYGAKLETELKVSCYADASFQTDNNNTKSQTGYVFVLNGGAVDWKSAKQITTIMSSTEAKYIATAEASMEVVWMRKFIDGLGGVVPSNKRPMEMLCDNKPRIAIMIPES